MLSFSNSIIVSKEQLADVERLKNAYIEHCNAHGVKSVFDMEATPCRSIFRITEECYCVSYKGHAEVECLGKFFPKICTYSSESLRQEFDSVDKNTCAVCGSNRMRNEVVLTRIQGKPVAVGLDCWDKFSLSTWLMDVHSNISDDTVIGLERSAFVSIQDIVNFVSSTEWISSKTSRILNLPSPSARMLNDVTNCLFHKFPLEVEGRLRKIDFDENRLYEYVRSMDTEESEYLEIVKYCIEIAEKEGGHVYKKFALAYVLPFIRNYALDMLIGDFNSEFSGSVVDTDAELCGTEVEVAYDTVFFKHLFKGVDGTLYIWKTQKNGFALGKTYHLKTKSFKVSTFHGKSGAVYVKNIRIPTP